jgi:hypothetical protein
VFSDQTYCVLDISKDIHISGGIFYISHVPVIIRIVIFVVLLTCIFKECNACVDLMLQLVVYAIFRTICALCFVLWTSSVPGGCITSNGFLNYQ